MNKYSMLEELHPDFNILEEELNDIQYSLLEDDENDHIIVNNEKLYPVFMITIGSDDGTSKMIQKFTHSDYSHASLAFGPGLSRCYSYSFDSFRDRGGFKIEGIKKYKEDYERDDFRLKVNVCFVKHEKYRLIRDRLDYYINNCDKSKYDYKSLFRIVLRKNVNITKKNDLALVCSTFVANTISAMGVNIAGGKSSSLVTPDDISKSDINNKQVYCLYKGTCKNYSIEKAKKKLEEIKSKASAIIESKNII